MLGYDFIYGGDWLSQFNMIMCDPKDEQAFVSRNIDKSDITPTRPSPFHFGVTYADTLKLDFLIVKDDEIVDSKKLSEEEIHYLRAWLESPKKPTELIVTYDSDDSTVHYYGIFTDVQPFIVAGTCYGLYLTFQCDSPYGYSDDIVCKYYPQSVGSFSGIYYNLSAEYQEYLLPKIIIKSTSSFGEGETLSIKNETHNRTMNISLPQGISGIIVDCKKKIITDTNGNLLPLSVLGITNTDQYTSIISLNTIY